MKKHYSVFFVALTLFVINGCKQEQKESADNEEEKTVQEEKAKKVTIDKQIKEANGIKKVKTISPKGVIAISSTSEFKKYINQGSVIAKFSTTWCGPCKMYAPIFKQVAEQTSGVIFLSVDADRNPTLSREYNISGVPTTIGFKDGQQIEKFYGANKNALNALVTKLQ